MSYGSLFLVALCLSIVSLVVCLGVCLVRVFGRLFGRLFVLLYFRFCFNALLFQPVPFRFHFLFGLGLQYANITGYASLSI